MTAKQVHVHEQVNVGKMQIKGGNHSNHTKITSPLHYPQPLYLRMGKKSVKSECEACKGGVGLVSEVSKKNRETVDILGNSDLIRLLPLLPNVIALLLTGLPLDKLHVLK